MFESKLRDMIQLTAVNRALKELIGELPYGCIVRVRFHLQSGGFSAKQYSYWSAIPLKAGDHAIVRVDERSHMDGYVFKRVVVEAVLSTERSLSELTKFDTVPKMIVAKVDESYKAVDTSNFKIRVKQIEADLTDKAINRMARDFETWLDS